MVRGVVGQHRGIAPATWLQERLGCVIYRLLGCAVATGRGGSVAGGVRGLCLAPVQILFWYHGFGGGGFGSPLSSFPGHSTMSEGEHTAYSGSCAEA